MYLCTLCVATFQGRLGPTVFVASGVSSKSLGEDWIDDILEHLKAFQLTQAAESFQATSRSVSPMVWKPIRNTKPKIATKGAADIR